MLVLAHPVPLTNVHFNSPLNHFCASFPVVECSHAWPHPVPSRMYIGRNMMCSISPADWPCISHLGQIRLAWLPCCCCFRWTLYCCVGALFCVVVVLVQFRRTRKRICDCHDATMARKRLTLLCFYAGCSQRHQRFSVCFSQTVSAGDYRKHLQQPLWLGMS